MVDPILRDEIPKPNRNLEKRNEIKFSVVTTQEYKLHISYSSACFAA